MGTRKEAEGHQKVREDPGSSVCNISISWCLCRSTCCKNIRTETVTVSRRPPLFLASTGYEFSGTATAKVTDELISTTEIYILTVMETLEVWDSGADRAGQESAPGLSPWRGGGHLLPVSSRCLLSLYPYVVHPNLGFSQGHQSFWIRRHSSDIILT